jgi:hypothetical protein
LLEDISLFVKQIVADACPVSVLFQ